MATITTSVAGIRQLSVGMRAAPSEVYTALRQRIRSAGDLIAADMRSRASFSSRIPGSVKVSQRVLSVTISANAPDAAPLNNKGQSGQFNHPVFATGDRATWAWASQQAQPFAEPALAAQKDAATALVTIGVVEAITSLFGQAV